MPKNAPKWLKKSDWDWELDLGGIRLHLQDARMGAGDPSLEVSLAAGFVGLAVVDKKLLGYNYDKDDDPGSPIPDAKRSAVVLALEWLEQKAPEALQRLRAIAASDPAYQDASKRLKNAAEKKKKPTLKELEESVRCAYANTNDEHHQMPDVWWNFRSAFFYSVLRLHGAGGSPDLFTGALKKDVEWAVKKINEGWREPPPLE